MSGMIQRRRPLTRYVAAAAGFAGIGLFAIPGHAQPYVWGWGGYWERPAPRYYYAPDYDEPAPERPYGAVPIAVIRQHIADAGFRLVAQPKRRGNIYLAAAEDRRGLRHRLVYDAMTGRLIESAVIQAPKTAMKPPARPTDEMPVAAGAKPTSRKSGEAKPEPAKVEPDTAMPKPVPVAVPAAPPPPAAPASSLPEPASTSVAAPERPAPSTKPADAAPEAVAPAPVTPGSASEEPK